MPRETPLALRLRARAILRRLARAHPHWGPTLEFSTPFELLVATILAAQARDERVNEVTRMLFKKYPAPAAYLSVGVPELDHEFGGVVPNTMEGLVSLRGVGRKTASIVLGNAFKVPAVAVDRHVARVATRLRLSGAADPDKIEENLRAIFPRKDWVKATWLLVLHGRRICQPTPQCYICPINDLCPYPKKTKDPAAQNIRRSRPRTASPRRARS